MKPAALDHNLAVVHDVPDAPDAPLARVEPIPPQRIGLPELDQVAVASYTSGDSGTVVEQARSLAEALAGPDGDATRRRTISRLVAVLKAQTALLDAATGAAMERGDLKAMEALSKMAERVSRRLVAALDEHRRELGRDAPNAVLLVGAANQIKIGRGK